ncbi:hypothetical protein HispidOSU_010677, partial [Sigmodon hispidus]
DPPNPKLKGPLLPMPWNLSPASPNWDKAGKTPTAVVQEAGMRDLNHSSWVQCATGIKLKLFNLELMIFVKSLAL